MIVSLLWDFRIDLFFCYALLYVHSSYVIILMAKRGLVVLLSLSCWFLVIVVWLCLVVPWVCLQFMMVVFLDRTHYFESKSNSALLGNTTKTLIYLQNVLDKSNPKVSEINIFPSELIVPVPEGKLEENKRC